MKTQPFKDSRYTITKEFTGAATPQFVIRFCGEFIASRSTYAAALMAATGERMRRQGALVIIEKASH